MYLSDVGYIGTIRSDNAVHMISIATNVFPRDISSISYNVLHYVLTAIVVVYDSTILRISQIWKRVSVILCFSIQLFEIIKRTLLDTRTNIIVLFYFHWRLRSDQFAKFLKRIAKMYNMYIWYLENRRDLRRFCIIRRKVSEHNGSFIASMWKNVMYNMAIIKLSI